LLVPATRMIASSLLGREEDRLTQRLERANNEMKSSILEEEESRLNRKLRLLKISFWAIFLPWVAMAVVAYAIHNQSVLLWRTFNANIVLLAPVMQPSELAKLRASFAGMSTGADYKAIRTQVLSVAKNQGVKVHDFEPW